MKSQQEVVCILLNGDIANLPVTLNDPNHPKLKHFKKYFCLSSDLNQQNYSTLLIPPIVLKLFYNDHLES